MATRLDRLVLLLDTGSTPSVRLTAARQLADLAAARVAHPSTADHSTWRGIEGEWSEVISLVSRILPFLENRSYETRTASSTALSLISKAVGVWDPTDFALPPSDSSDESTSTSAAAISLSSFNLSHILRDGSLLLASSGSEYAKVSSNLTSEELAKAQKDALAKLGLGLGAGGGGSKDELGVDFEEELKVEEGGAGGGLPPPHFKPERSLSLSLPPLPSTSTSTSTSPLPALPSLSAETPLTEDEDPFAGLSARERNKLKRKRKTVSKSSSNGGGPPPSAAFSAPPTKVRVVSEPTSSENRNGAVAVPVSGVEGEKVIIDPGAKARQRELEAASGGGEVVVDGDALGQEGMEVKAGEWPWRGTVERLAVGLLSPVWEIRHGAALGLREVLKLQGAGGGQIAGFSKGTNELAHKRWSDDLATKLLCVFALDRFGDYISDQVVAPVRETAAQALATLLPFMSNASVVRVQSILIQMVDQDGSPPSQGIEAKQGNGTGKNGAAKINYVWQVRHSGLLGLKYLVAVKGDLLRGNVSEEKDLEMESDVKTKVEEDKMMADEEEPKVKAEGDMDVKPWVKDELDEGEQSLHLLKSLVDAAVLGLRDRDDDVRSAAAATLTPITDALVSLLPVELCAVVSILWDCLGDLKDDLSSSIGGVMDLLANLLAFPSVLKLIRSPSLGHSLPELVPRLFPFFRHTISSVRLAVLNTVLVFLNLPSTDHSWADERLLRLLFQNLVVEERSDIKTATSTAWRTCLTLRASRLTDQARPHVDKWFGILQTPVGTPIDTGLFWSAKLSLSGQRGFVYNVDRPILNQDLGLVSVERILGGRVAASIALGELIASWPSDSRDETFRHLLTQGLASESAFRRYLIATVVEEWATYIYSTTLCTPLDTSPLASQLAQDITSLLQKEPPATYTEMTSVLERLQTDCQVLYSLFGQQGKVPAPKLPVVPAIFGLQQARQVLTSFDALVPLMGRGTKKTVLPALDDQHRKISAAVGYYEARKARHDRQAYAALAGALVALRVIPAKVTPLIRSITTSIKTEDILELQNRAARSIAAFIDICSSPASTLKNNPSDKVIKNLCTFLCQDVSRTPIFASAKNKSNGILTLEYKPARGTVGKESKESTIISEEVATAKLVYRGAQLALSQLAERFGADLLERVPKLWNCMSDALVEIFGSGDIKTADAILAGADSRGQDLLDCLTVLPTGAQKVGESLHVRLAGLFPYLALATQSKFSVVRYAVARCFASLCDSVPTEGLRHVVETIIPVLSDPLNVNNRRGAIEVISHIVEILDIKILPYVIFLVVPVLGRMSDSDDDVRLVATNTFATLVKLVPLEAGLPDPVGFPAELLVRRQHERDFLAQLLDGSKVEEYNIPVPISIELRKYQRDGVSWLAFLAKYQLHGLLCDDMGLGKTLQSICILSSKHFERAQRHAETNSPDSVHLPSLVICPPTLTGHWKQEIKTYAPNLVPVVYTGSKGERERLLASISKSDVVIASYDIVRNDIEALAGFEWHYCILDEGHIIKNGKTKLTKAIKTIHAIHRLILSGTPIQNNVLELWSLFDFLMPGFLGSEAAFNDRFGKPIAASRDAKSSSKEQEAGTLALDALHKQVLPFLLRRLKEDVLDDLPPKIIQDYYCELSPIQKQLYDDFSTSQAKVVAGEVASAASGGGQPQHVFQALQYLRKLVNHPALVMKADVPKHQEILAQLEHDGGKLRNIANAPKLQALRQILLDCGIGTSSSSTGAETFGDVSQHRVLIFCQLKQMLDIVENDLFRALMPTVTYMRMDGSTDVSKRHAVVQTFNSDPSIDCLLLTTHVGGLGLNLTGADTVIFVEHDWNPMKDLQAMDRAHRLGQKKVVNVYRLIMRGTLEEKIMGLQRFKLNIASSVVTQQNTDLASLGTDSVLDLFTVSSSDAAPVLDKDRPAGQKTILEGLGDLPPEDEYSDLLDMSSFTASR